jgi:hypothetical protein
VTLPAYRAEELFRDVWARIDRAEVHKREAMDIWAEYLGDEPYDITLDVDDTGHARLWVDVLNEPPRELSIVFGEYLQNLRTALDYCVLAVAAHDTGQDPPPHEGDLMFPVCITEAAWEKSGSRLRGFTEQHRTWVMQMQPFRGPNPRDTAVYVLNDLARKDRHRRLHAVGAWVAQTRPAVNAPAAKTVTWDRVVQSELIEGPTVLVEFTVHPYAEGDTVEANPDTILDLEFAEFAALRESSAWVPLPLNQRLYVMESVVRTSVGLLERDCTGYTRVNNLLKPSAEL